MSRGIKPEKIVASIKCGIQTAYKKYDDMAGFTLDIAPEYFVVCEVASAISRRNGCQVTIEHSVKNIILKHAKATKPGRPKAISRFNGRFDLVVWRKDDITPHGLVEIKHPIYNSNRNQLQNDIKRICEALSRNKDSNALKFGILAFYSSMNSLNKKKVDFCSNLKKIKALAESCLQSECKSKFDYSPPKQDKFGGERWLWSACVILIQRNNL